MVPARKKPPIRTCAADVTDAETSHCVAQCSNQSQPDETDGKNFAVCEITPAAVIRHHVAGDIGLE